MIHKETWVLNQVAFSHFLSQLIGNRGSFLNQAEPAGPGQVRRGGGRRGHELRGGGPTEQQGPVPGGVGVLDVDAGGGVLLDVLDVGGVGVLLNVGGVGILDADADDGVLLDAGVGVLIDVDAGGISSCSY